MDVEFGTAFLLQTAVTVEVSTLFFLPAAPATGCRELERPVSAGS